MEKEKRNITFAGNHSHEYGLNFTVRMGNKWADLEIGEEIKLTDEHGRLPVEAKIVMVIKSAMCEVPDFVLQKEHDSKCRTMTGLYKTLKQFYRDLDFESTVTCIGYIV